MKNIIHNKMSPLICDTFYLLISSNHKIYQNANRNIKNDHKYVIVIYIWITQAFQLAGEYGYNIDNPKDWREKNETGRFIRNV